MLLTELFAKLGLEVDGGSFSKGFGAITDLKSALDLLKGAAVAVGKAISEFTLDVVEAGDHIDEMAQSTGLSTDELQELAYAGSFSSLSMEDMAQSVGFLSKNMAAASAGSKEMKAVFKKAGVSIKNQDGTLRSASDVMQDLADHFASMPDSAEKTALSMKVFGRAGKALIPLLNAGGDGLRQYAEEAHRLGVVMDESMIKKSAEIDDNMNRLKMGWQGIKIEIGQKLLPVLGDLTSKMFEWVMANKEAISSGIQKFFEGLFVAAKATYDAIVFVVDGVKQFIEEFKKGEGPIYNVVTLLDPFVGLLGAIYRNWGQVKAAMKATWAVIAKFLEPILRLLGPILEFIRKHWDEIVKVMKYAMAAVLLPIIAVIASMVAMFVALGAAILVVVSAIADLINWFRGAESTIGSFLEKIGSRLYASFVQPFIDAGVAVKEAFGAAIDWIAAKINWVMDKVNTAIDYANKVPGVNIGNRSLGPVLERAGLTGAGTPGSVSPALPGGGQPALEEKQGSLGPAISQMLQFNVTQNPGESGEEFSRRVAEIVAQENERTMREAMAGVH